MECKVFKPFRSKLFYLFTDRYGGVSPKPYQSLNLAHHVGDDIRNVMKNRLIVAKEHNIDLRNLVYMDQIHSDNITVVRDSMQTKISDTDALITNEKGIYLMVLVADCIPVLFFDPIKGVVAAAHAGRAGTFKDISKKTVLKMKEVFGSDPKDVRVCLGPSINSCCYEVSKEIADITAKNFGQKYVIDREGGFYLDLQTLNKDQLLDAGVEEKNISISNDCSCCSEEYFSYRREGLTGRFAGVIGLK